ncbi:GntR family transcriptional regulator [Radiobacillus kanasensis]|uniref:GntR family transcriptional regulator n=1 Tax=Radiobacillus kanasensis TaxID=2844358 RepID=UPI001E45E338|nr:GntR family transcriptional regulator [Radiobacillus kanasensis]UFU00023.1 GntR family transcriptional regulator [Radiobacillus kanasensis]
MKHSLDDNRPIYHQIKEHIEDSIISEAIGTGERVPSTNEFASFFKINPATAAKGVNELVDEGILVKRRGVGMFVTEDARSILIQKRKDSFFKSYVIPLRDEAKKLQITETELLDMIQKGGEISED